MVLHIVITQRSWACELRMAIHHLKIAIFCPFSVRRQLILYHSLAYTLHLFYSFTLRHILLQLCKIYILFQYINNQQLPPDGLTHFNS